MEPVIGERRGGQAKWMAPRWLLRSVDPLLPRTFTLALALGWLAGAMGEPADSPFPNLEIGGLCPVSARRLVLF